ncbi:galactose mutarotase [Reichenbachiella carrageenanivorans]|uniref:Aldose 1-epimerase n=1 Tax=Reichenbachiella carrageenanivorans TaxID=2979869 RepID=A0ABY6D4F1_9BACT|nr:aldose epimerase family protein [Reichenbachiella carrageenanivorans]UXX81025.1 galactose mutarotase [Reichenbachiella carrageenanivorans]
MNQLNISFTLIILCISCRQNPEAIKLIDNANFQEVVDEKDVDLYTLKNQSGLTAQITNYGGRVVSLWVPDKNGNFADIVLGYDSLQGYLVSSEIYFGALIGRYGNRINKGQFTLQDSTYSLATNNGDHHLHGGDKGFNNVVWDAIQVSDVELKLHYLSKDGEEGYPGNLDVVVTYKLTDNNELEINYVATTDRATPVNLTHHSFFNLHGAGQGSINDHILQINATKYTPVTDGLIPTGTVEEVLNTPFDFTAPMPIGARVNSNHQQLNYGYGYDHNFILDGEGMKLAATVVDPISMRKMEVFTDEPGLQFYGGNFLSGKEVGKGDLPYEYRTAFCLETQHFPDSPNQDHFPSTILAPGETYTSTCIYKFSVQ